MATTFKITTTITSDSSTGSVAGTQVEVGDGELNTSIPIPAGSVNYPLAISWSADKMQAVVFKSDRNLSLDLMVGTHPIASIDLIGGSPFVWGISNGYWERPITSDPAWLEVSAVQSCTLQIMVLLKTGSY